MHLLPGLVLDSKSKGVPGAKFQVSGISKDVVTTSRGEYWRLLVPGTYHVTVEAAGYVASESQEVVVNDGRATTLNITLAKANEGKD